MFSVALVALSSALAAQATVFTVQVGANNGLVYSPNTVTAAVGDTINFQFTSKNHTVTQSTFAAPCVASAGGINSGFQPVPAGATQFATWGITLNSTDPLWFHCGQTTPVNHCQMGMVLAINPTADKSFAAFQTAAMSGAAAPAAAAPVGGAAPGAPNVIPPPTSLPTGGPVAGANSVPAVAAPSGLTTSFGVPSAAVTPAAATTSGGSAPASSTTQSASGALAVRGVNSGVALGTVTLFAAVAGLLL